MGMDLMNIMKQVQNVQKKAGVIQEELANLEVTGESAGGAVKVICDGQGRFKSISIKPEAINPENPSSVDSETIEKASAEMESRMNQLTGGLKIPGLFGK